MISRVLVAALVALLVACAGVDKAPLPLPVKGMQWPESPAGPRIVFEGAFSTPSDLGIRKGVFQRLSDNLTGSTSQAMVHPRSVFLSSKGVLFVGDSGLRGVHAFDRPRNRYRFLSGDGVIGSPVGITEIADGRILVADSEQGRILSIGVDLERVAALDLEIDPVQPTGIFYHKGRLFVADTAAHKIYAFTDDGKVAMEIGGRGTAQERFNFPTMLWVDRDGDLLVVDALNFRIQRFDMAGNFVASFGRLGDGSGDLMRPKGIAVDGFGHVYVVDSLFHAFQVFSKGGEYLLGVGQMGQGNGEFWLPTGLFIDEEDKIYVCDSYNNRVQIFRYVDR